MPPPRRKLGMATMTSECVSSDDGQPLMAPVRSPPRKKKAMKPACASVDTDGGTSVCSMKSVSTSKVSSVGNGYGREKKDVPKKDAVGRMLELCKNGDMALSEIPGGMADPIKMIMREMEELLILTIVEKERLEGEVKGLRQLSKASFAEVARAAATSVVAAPVKKPVATWSLVVRSKNKDASSKDVATKVVKEVGPTLGVRVHEVKPIKSGGVVLRVPSKAEREKVAKNAKFTDVGLQVSGNDKLGPKVVILGVHSEITPDEFMQELFEMNIKEKMTLDQFKSVVKLVSRPWKAATDVAVNVILEGSGVAMDILLENGRCYVKRFSFRVRSFSPMPGCYRCMGFDHGVAECRAKKDVRRRCGQQGHKAMQCNNEPHC